MMVSVDAATAVDPDKIEELFIQPLTIKYDVFHNLKKFLTDCCQWQDRVTPDELTMFKPMYRIPLLRN